MTVLSASVPVREIYNYRLTATSEDQNISVQSENIAPLSGGGNTTASEIGTVSVPLSKGFVDGKIAYFLKQPMPLVKKLFLLSPAPLASK